MEIVCVGNLNFDLTFVADRLPDAHEKLRAKTLYIDCGGAAGNTAYWLSRLGASVRMVGCVGQDELGELAVRSLATAGVDTRFIQRTKEASTGAAAIFSLHDNKCMVTGAGANALFLPERVPNEAFEGLVHLHLTAGALAKSEALVQSAHRSGATVSCDFNGPIEPAQTRLCDLIFINSSDLERSLGLKTWQEAYSALELTGEKLLIVTRGGEGAVVVCEGEEHAFPACETAVVDPTGGGDALVGAFIFERVVRGASAGEALMSGLKLAAAVVGRRGVRPVDIDALRVLAG